MLLLQPMDLWTFFTSTWIVLLQNDHNDTTHRRWWEFYIHFRQQTHTRGSLPACLEEESPSKSSKFFCPSGKVHTVTTKKLQPAHSVQWVGLMFWLHRSLVTLRTNLRLLFPILSHPSFPWSPFYLYHVFQIQSLEIHGYIRPKKELLGDNAWLKMGLWRSILFHSGSVQLSQWDTQNGDANLLHPSLMRDVIIINQE